MLRSALTDEPIEAATEDGESWRVSSGSAAVLGLCELRMETAPTTAYLMLGERCRRNCAFCAQARESAAPAAALSRVMWPTYGSGVIAAAVARGFARGQVQRACLQMTVTPEHIARAAQAVAALSERSQVPVCVSAAPQRLEEVAALLEAGAERVTIALDAASERVYRATKGGSWEQTLALIEAAAARFPARLGTHLIVGLGETEREMVALMQRLHDLGVSLGLFAFTPVRGTRLAEATAPPLAQYRRVQAARWLLVHDQARAEQMAFAENDGRITALGLGDAVLRVALAAGDAFRTAGCPGCNRPYYNERPGGVMYNYPRPLSSVEAQAELAALLAGLAA